MRLATPRRLQTRLTLLYAAMFGLVLAGVCGLTWAAVSTQAQRGTEAELVVAGGVYERLWHARDDRVRSGAEVLSKDFGFREALASRDAPTIGSAVENLRDRLHQDAAFTVDADGVLLDPAGAPAEAPAIAEALARTGEAEGVISAPGRAPLEVVSAPILAPQLQGWVVFGSRLSASSLAQLASLSPLPLTAEVLRGGPAGWTDTAGRPIPLRLPRGENRPGRLTTSAGEEYAVLRRLATPQGAAPAALLLHYPVAAALAPYRTLLALISGLGLLGLSLVAVGSWMLARSITRPIAALAAAARRLREGDVAHVEADGSGGGEVAALADGFNAMVDAVAEREAHIRLEALVDQDTRLPNRRALEEQAAEQRDVRLVAAAFGVDQFARMRGVLGSELALEVMRALGERLAALQPGWRVGRTAGDTLTALIVADDVEETARHVEAARRTLEAAVPAGGHLIDVRVTTGLSSDATGHPIRDAELALDSARAGGLRHTRFDEAARARAADSLNLMPELRRAIARDALSLAHQPKWDVRKGEVAGVESLIRWTHPTRGPIAPDAFIGLAEETGDIRALTEWVVTRAVAEQAQLTAEGAPLSFSLNLSGRLVGDRHHTRWLLDALASVKAPVCLEITETAVIGDPEAALATFAELREAGVGVSIDDYGSGLSSLAYLKRIAADELKLDRSLIADLAVSARDALLIRSTIDLAHALGMRVVSEGVEDPVTMAALAGMGCDQIQGWHIAKPMPLTALKSFLAARRPLEGASRAVG